MIVVSSLAMVYYNMIIAYSLFYFGSSFSNPLPWTLCNQWWNKLDTRALCEIIAPLNDTQMDCSVNKSLSIYYKDDQDLADYWTDQFASNATYQEFQPVNVSALFDRDSNAQINRAGEFWTLVLRLFENFHIKTYLAVVCSKQKPITQITTQAKSTH